MSTVTVPCCSPVSIVFMPRRCISSLTSSGVAEVHISQSFGSFPSRPSRTHPPTTYASWFSYRRFSRTARAPLGIEILCINRPHVYTHNELLNFLHIRVIWEARVLLCIIESFFKVRNHFKKLWSICSIFQLIVTLTDTHQQRQVITTICDNILFLQNIQAEKVQTNKMHRVFVQISEAVARLKEMRFFRIRTSAILNVRGTPTTSKLSKILIVSILSRFNYKKAIQYPRDIRCRQICHLIN